MAAGNGAGPRWIGFCTKRLTSEPTTITASIVCRLKVSTVRNDSVSSAPYDPRRNGFRSPCLRLSTWRRSRPRPAERERTRRSLRTTSGFLKQERCSQRRIRADVLDELVWDEVSTRLQDPGLILEAHQTHKTQRRDSADEDGSSEKDQRLQAQIKLANRELSRLLDAYQCGALELPELQKRRQLVNSKLEMLNREQELLRKMSAEQKKETDIKASLAEFAALVSTSLKRISFENKQKLLRMVVDKVVVNDWRVDVHYNIPLPKPTPTPEQKVSTKFDLRSTCTQ